MLFYISGLSHSVWRTSRLNSGITYRGVIKIMHNHRFIYERKLEVFIFKIKPFEFLAAYNDVLWAPRLISNLVADYIQKRCFCADCEEVPRRAWPSVTKIYQIFYHGPGISVFNNPPLQANVGIFRLELK